MGNKCRICGINDANAKKSHQLPSFLAVMVSFDGSYKRGKELMFSFYKYRTGIYAFGLSSTDRENIFDDLSLERLRDLSKNPVSEDFVFCKDCEEALGKYLENQYSVFDKEGRKIDNDLPLMFWISIAWRLSVQKTNGFSLGEELEQYLRKILNQYLCYKREKRDVSELVASSKVSYKILKSRDYCRNKAVFSNANMKHRINC